MSRTGLWMMAVLTAACSRSGSDGLAKPEAASLAADVAVPVTLTAGYISLPFSGVPESICNWEKTLQMADMALYLGKAHGRNRAYGLSRLLVPHEQAMAILDHDLSAAIAAGMVELIEVIGPIQSKVSDPKSQEKM